MPIWKRNLFVCWIGVFSTPMLGKLSDEIGPHKVIMIALIVVGVLYIPQAYVKNPWQLLVFRFMSLVH